MGREVVLLMVIEVKMGTGVEVILMMAIEVAMGLSMEVAMGTGMINRVTNIGSGQSQEG